MRIKALSKKLNLPVAEIGRILQTDSTENTLANLKLSEDELEKVLKFLGKTLEDLDKVENVETELEPVESAIEEELVESNSDTIVPQSVVEENKLEEKDFKPEDTENKEVDLEESKVPTNSANSKVEIIDTGETTLHIVDGVITAPKVELQGLTIKGKIDLPEKKVPSVEEKPENQEVSNEVPKVIPVYIPKPKVKKEVKNTEEIHQKNKEKQETLAAKKALELQKIREKEAKRKAFIDEQKKAHYFENVVAKQPVVKKAKKKKTESKPTTAPINEAKKVVSTVKKSNPPKGFWGKFKAWLNGE